ncbi:MAG: lipopolysaccharide biosynthesis protein [Planctomycetota bacterium]
MNLPIMGPGVRSILRNGGFMMGANLTESALRAVYLLALVRFITPVEYGLWTYGGATYGLAIGLVIFGFNFLIANRIGADRAEAESFIAMTLVLRIGLLVMAAAGMVVYAITVEPPGLGRTILLIFIPAILGRGLGIWARICFLAYESQGAYLLVSVTLRFIEVGLGLVWLANGGSLLNVVFLHSSIWVIEGLAGIVMTRWLLTKYVFDFRTGEIILFLKKGTVLGLGGALGVWLIAGPLVLLRHVSADLVLVGQVGLALNVTMILVASVQGFMGSAVPVLSRSFAREDPRLNSYGRLTAFAALGGAVAAGAIGFAVGPPAATLALGPDFAIAGALLGPCLFIGGLILAPNGYAQILVIKGRRWPNVCANGVAGLVLLLLMAPAVGAWGGLGATAAIAMTWITRAVILVGVAQYLEKYLEISRV